MRLTLATSELIFIAVRDKIIAISINEANERLIREYSHDWTASAAGTKGSEAAVVCIAISADGKHLFAGFDNKWIYCWDVDTNVVLGSKLCKKRPTALAYGEFNRQQRKVCQSDEGTLSKVLMYADKFGEVWGIDAPNFQQSAVLCMAHTTSIITEMILNKNQYFITSDRDEKIRVQLFPNTVQIVSYCLGHSKPVTSMTLITDSLLVSTGWDHKIIMWDFVSGELLAELDMSPKSEIVDDSATVAHSPVDAEEEADDEVVDEDEDADGEYGPKQYDDVLAGHYPLKIISLNSPLQTDVVGRVAIIFKGLSECRLYSVQQHARGHSIVLEDTLQFSENPVDIETLKSDELVVLLPKPYHVAVVSLDGQSRSHSSLETTLKEYCEDNHVSFVQQGVVVAAGDNDDGGKCV